MSNHYETLGVRKNALQQEIKDQYRFLSKKYHPDKNPGDKAAEQRFKEIANAYEVISDPERRIAYDLTGSDVTEREMDAKGAGLLQQIFQLVVQKTGLAQMQKLDLIGELQVQLDSGMKGLKDNVVSSVANRKALGLILKRVKHKNKNNSISVVLKAEIQKHTETITKSKHEMEIGKRAMEQLKEYGFDFVVEQDAVFSMRTRMGFGHSFQTMKPVHNITA